MSNIKNRIKKIEKKLDVNNKTQWLRIPDPDNPGNYIECKGCKTLAELLRTLNK